MTQQTCLYQAHIDAGGRMVDFASWQMPVHYGSQIDEHHAVRRAAGVFDVSHMCAVDIAGPQAEAFLQKLLANDVAKIAPGRVLYSCMLTPEGGVIDDLIVYRRAADAFRTVVNAGTAEKDIAWMQQQVAGFDAAVRVRRDLGILALQGPQAKDRLTDSGLSAELVAAALERKPFGCDFSGDDYLLGRTGYTGEDGFEIVAPLGEIPGIWKKLLDAGVQPCGLGARDTLRLEAGMALYGQDMDEGVSPLASGLGWTIAWEPAEREFFGRAALEAQAAAGDQPKMIGLVLEDRGVLRAHQVVHTDAGPGEITSGGFAPTLERSIALARVPRAAALPVGARVEVEIRNKRLAARVVKYPFVRHGQSKID
ncbi:MAG: glycine cleavage system aminomethyltransferase GcvT [Oceanococcaceae bacterium]